MLFLNSESNILKINNNHYKFVCALEHSNYYDIIIGNINNFIKQLSVCGLIKKRIHIKLYEGRHVCLARLYDHNKKLQHMPNINKRCKKKAIAGWDLCDLHNNIEKTRDWHLRVTEYPDQLRTIHEYQIRPYFNNRKKITKLYDSINLDHDLIQKNFIANIYLDGTNIYLNKLNKNKKLKTKNNINNNSKMSQIIMMESFYDNLELYELTKEEYNSKLENYITKMGSLIDFDYNNENKIKECSKEFLKTIDITFPNTLEVTAVSAGLLEGVKQYKSKPNKSKSIKNIDIYTLDSILFIDNFEQYQLYVHNVGDKQLLYNNNKKNIGFLRDWIDEEGEVPDVFKKNNTVLHPDTNIPILEIEITINGSAFESIKAGIYREYEYEEDLECFRQTCKIYPNN
jgi:hypothetical protein